MVSVPIVKSHKTIDAHGAKLRMLELALEVLLSKGAEQRDPARVDALEKRKRDFHRREFGVLELGPGGFIVGLDGGRVFSQRQLAADVRVHMAVRNMVCQ